MPEPAVLVAAAAVDALREWTALIHRLARNVLAAYAEWLNDEVERELEA